MSDPTEWRWPPTLWLRPLDPGDEPAVAAAHATMALDDFEFAFDYPSGQSWAEYLADVERKRIGAELRDGRVPATFLVADVQGEIVGRSSIRHRLNPFLEHEGGHIGFGVLPHARRRGYATEILRQSLVIARSLGIRRALLTCDDDNVGSATVIETCGGILDSIVDGSTGKAVRRYWIDGLER
jgi:predicted acetyltransferase